MQPKRCHVDAVSELIIIGVSLDVTYKFYDVTVTVCIHVSLEIYDYTNMNYTYIFIVFNLG